ncbi:MAG: alpha/beta hydrolase [Actinobacteria bacterium]|nr:alpha/beta hydrolase [Actinomycetota bacterium]
MLSRIFREYFADLPSGKICYIDEGEGPAVVLLHGMASSAVGSWWPTIEHLSRYSRVIAPDYPGFGKSDFVNTQLTPAFISSVVISLLDKLAVRDFVVVGNSMGGVPALHMTLYYEKRVTALILVDAAGSYRVPSSVVSKFKFENIAKTADRLNRILRNAGHGRRFLKYRCVRRLAGIYQMNEYTERLITEEIDIIERRNIHEHAEAWIRAGNGLLSVSYASKLGEINLPTLIVWGQKDPFLPVFVARRFNRLINGSSLVIIPEAGHVPQLDRPELVSKAVNRFLCGSLNLQ